MARNWEETFKRWAKAPSKTERARCDNAEKVVRNAIKESSLPKKSKIKVFAQGSYHNRTNVPGSSDVDICVLRKDLCFRHCPSDIDLGSRRTSCYTNIEFKDDVCEALRSYLGKGSVQRGNKSLKLRNNTYRVNADVVACFSFQEWFREGGLLAFHEGTGFKQESGSPKLVVNWPDQNYANACSKNKETAKRFKKIVRVLKCLRNEMAGAGIKAAKPIPSFLIESLVYNVPDQYFFGESYVEDIVKTPKLDPVSMLVRAAQSSGW